jgi:hypothetical protein
MSRDRDGLQPEICQVTGRLVPADDLVISEVDGLEGVAVGSTAPWLADVRSRPSYEDLRGIGPPPHELYELGPSGGALWFLGEGTEDFVPEATGLLGWYKPQTEAGLTGNSWPDASGAGNDLTSSSPPTSGDQIPGTNVFGWVFSNFSQLFSSSASLVPVGTAHFSAMMLVKRPLEEPAGSQYELILGFSANSYPRCYRRVFQPQGSASSGTGDIGHSDALTGGADIYEAHFDFRSHRRSAVIIGNDRRLVDRTKVTRGVTTAGVNFFIAPIDLVTGEDGTAYALLVWARSVAQGPVPDPKIAEARSYLNSLRDGW